MSTSSIITPVTAINLAWAIASKYVSNPDGEISAQNAENILLNITSQASLNSAEKSSISQISAAIYATVRNLEIIYKGRNLNFEENEKLRKSYIDNVKDAILFGNKAKDFLKSLPTMAIAGPGVSLTLGPTLAKWIVPENPELFLAGMTIALTGLGYLIHMLIVWLSRKKTQQLYLEQDYERNLYYDHYIARVKAALSGLYHTVARINQSLFNVSYSDNQNNVSEIIGVLEGIRPTMCKYVHKHMRSRIITPLEWTLCEVGEPQCKECPYWDNSN